MTDARYPERWLNDRRLFRLGGEAFKIYVVALAWSVANRTDGVISRADLDLLPGVELDHLVQLLVADLWDELEDNSGYVIVDFEATQTSSHDLGVLENARRRDREKKRRRRADRAVPRDVPGDAVPRDDTRTGQDRPGQAPNVGGHLQDAKDQEEKHAREESQKDYYDPNATGPCARCGKGTKAWVLAERDGFCIDCSRRSA